MGKIFLSHSSDNKEYVEPIATYFGKDRCVYDAMCFEVGMKTLDEIFKELDKTSVFVFFISNSSLNSEWVRVELFQAEARLNDNREKLSQIYPIIIDDSVSYNDKRIPDFMKHGFGSYNLRSIKNHKVALRKIETQLFRRQYEKNLSFRRDVFYGRNAEIKNFQNKYDCGQGLRCVIASGIEGIGRRSFLKAILRESEIITAYYEPASISLARNDNIEDIILKLVDLGFGDYSYEAVVNASDMERKIDILVSQIEEIQNQNEYVIVYDNACLLDYSGELKYWIVKAIERTRCEIALCIAASARLSFTFLKNHSTFYSIELSTLEYPEWNGLLRVYSNQIGIDFSAADREYFKDIITGYPPQVICCADLAKEQGVENAKLNGHEIVKNISGKITEILDVAVAPSDKEAMTELLAFLSSYGLTPISELNGVFQLNKQYKDVFQRLRSLTICRHIGMSNDYVEVNPVIADYIQRNNFKLPDAIKDYLSQRTNEFNDKIGNMVDVDYIDFESIRYYIKENLKSGVSVPEKLLYSTVYLNALKELYDSEKYNEVIELMKKVKENGAFYRLEFLVQEKMQRYYCLALARQTDLAFYDEVEFFKQNRMIVNYNFLRGFMYRQNGEYDKSLDRYRKVLADDARHSGAMREIVAVYRALEDHDNYESYAKIIYLRNPENLYNIQPYFESIVRKEHCTLEEHEHIDNMLKTIYSINQMKPTPLYYEIYSSYQLLYKHDPKEAERFLVQGKANFPDSIYIARSLFDFYEHSFDPDRMGIEISRLRALSENNRAATISLELREVKYNAHLGTPRDAIITQINAINGITDDTRKKLLRRVDSILQKTC